MKAKIYECENCNDCPIKSKCTKAKGNKRIQISPVFITKRKQSQDNIVFYLEWVDLYKFKVHL